MTNRGDVVVFDFPYADGSGSKIRPCLVVQNDTDNHRLHTTVVAMITGNLRHAHEPTQLLVDPSTPEGRTSGLHGPSVVKCIALVTLDSRQVIRVLGKLCEETMRQIDDCLKAALAIP